MRDVYFRIYEDDRGRLVAVEMQDFDESDYIQSRFLATTKFDTEAEALDVIRGIEAFVGRKALKTPRLPVPVHCLTAYPTIADGASQQLPVAPMPGSQA